MLMCDQMTDPDTGAEFALPAVVASFSQFRVVVINHRNVTLFWRSREQR